MEEEIKTYGDLIKVIEKYDLEDKPIVLGVDGYNTYCYQKSNGNYELDDKTIRLMEINDFIVLCDNCGNYEEDLFRQEQLREED